jgi:hypothetical protein
MPPGKPEWGVVDLVVGLVAGDPDLLGIDDDDEITGIDVRRVDGLVLAAQTEGDFTGHPAENLIGCVNHKPLMRHLSRFGAEGFHGSLILCSPPVAPVRSASVSAALSGEARNAHQSDSCGGTLRIDKSIAEHVEGNLRGKEAELRGRGPGAQPLEHRRRLG